MLSGMQAREFGLGLGTLFSDDIRAIVNEKHKGQNYKAESDAMLVMNNKRKSNIKDDPLLRYFRAGVYKE